ncbi:MAG: carbon starvation protein A [Candidatus Omnitrophica bacterium]|nr:carbon starvation protein A [Candidatus Omnitrophota bacterium]
MNALVLLVFSAAGLWAGYHWVGRFLERCFGVDPTRLTPAHTLRDGSDFEPARNAWVLFGHHFASIAGAGPVVGPALAVIYWGWGPAILWLVLGSVFMGGVADFASLFVSVRNDGASVARIAGIEISARARIFLSLFLWVALILVIGVFAIFGAKTLIQEPDAVIPSFGLIPVAVLTGWLLYRTRLPNLIATGAGLIFLGALLVAGSRFPLHLTGVGPWDSQTVWLIILFVYCFVASVIPVQVLLQPRDYLASFLLLAVVGIGLVSIAWVHPSMLSGAIEKADPLVTTGAGPLWPMLFVTVACGAISGFHAVVSSGTSSKQIASEAHIRPIGYGAMLTESLLGVIVVIAVGAGLSRVDAAAALKSGGPISVFSRGYGNLSAWLMGDYGRAFAVLGLNAFILTTLDTCTRITRYITTECFGLRNKYAATAIVVGAGAFLAFSGKWNLLWPVFGTANQLIAAVALLLAGCWLANRGVMAWFAFIPAGVMLLITLSAFVIQLRQSIFYSGSDVAARPDWMLTSLTAGLIVLELIFVAETLSVWSRRSAGRRL